MRNVVVATVMRACKLSSTVLPCGIYMFTVTLPLT